MDFTKIIGGIFAIGFSIILFLIIRYALKIMYKDVKNGTKKNKPQRQRPKNANNMGNNNVRSGATGTINTSDANSLNRTGINNRAAVTGSMPVRRPQPRPTQAVQNRPAQRAPQNNAARPRTTQERPIPQRPQGRGQNRVPSVEVLKCRPGSNIKIGSIITVNRIITLGRRNDNLIVLNDNFASSYHAKLYLRNGEIILEDLNSTNGTFVNQRPIKGKIRLRINDEIRLGETIFKVIG